MKKILTAALALSIMGGAAAQAAPRDNHDRRDNQRYEQRYDRGDRHDQRFQQRRWARGQYVPASYRTRAYVVNDYRRYHLAPPPRGYHYVRQDNNDVVLAAIATGLIASVFIGAFGN